MSFDQAAILGLLLCMFAVYALERFRIEVVALTGLAVAYLLGLVPYQNLFAGFANSAVITVVEILLIVTVLARTRLIEQVAQAIVSRARSERAALAILCGSAALVSVSMNNIGALALMFPVTLSVCARLGVAPARMLMPLSFAILLGGTCSLTGTPANLVVNDWLISQTGGGFGYFELALIGAPVTIAGVVWLVVSAPWLMRDGGAEPVADDHPTSDFLGEIALAAGSPLIGLALPEAERQGALSIHGVVRGGAHVFARRGAIVLAAGDTLLAEGELAGIDLLRGGAGDERLEVVVMPDSVILGSRLEALEAFAEHGVRVVALASRRRRIEGRFNDLQIGLGDVLVLEGERGALREAAADAGVLPLAPRAPSVRQPEATRSLAIFGLGIAATAVGLAPPEIAFGAVVIVLAMLGSLKLRSALQELNWTIVILLACMIPLGIAVQDTGAAETIASAIVGHLPTTQPFFLAALVLVLAALITPFVDNVSTAAVLSPIAAGISSRAGVPIEPLLMAVAVGASLDFLTPFGHHNNAVVMGVAGYRFSEFPRLGAPLLLVCLVAGIAALRICFV